MAPDGENRFTLCVHYSRAMNPPFPLTWR